MMFRDCTYNGAVVGFLSELNLFFRNAFFVVGAFCLSGFLLMSDVSDKRNFVFMLLPFYLLAFFVGFYCQYRWKSVWIFDKKTCYQFNKQGLQYNYKNFDYLELAESHMRGGMDILVFYIGGKKYKSRMKNEDDYLRVKSRMSKEVSDRSAKIKKELRECNALYLSCSIPGVILILASAALLFWRLNQEFLIKSQDQLITTKQSTPVPLSGEVTFGHIGQTLYAFSESQAAVNAYDLTGRFQYALKVSQSTNGKAYMYIKDDLLFIKARNHNVYWFGSGNFRGVIQTIYSDKSVEFAVFDEKKKLIQVVDLEKDSHYIAIMYLDHVLYYYHYSDSGDILYKNDGKTETKLGVYRDNAPPYVAATSTLKINGAEYSETFGDIHLSKGNTNRVIVKAELSKWYFYTPIVVFPIFLLGVLLSWLIPTTVKSAKIKRAIRRY